MLKKIALFCLGLLAINISTECSSNNNVGNLIATAVIVYAAVLVKNYVQYPDPEAAIKATNSDISSVPKNLTLIVLRVPGFQESVEKAHLQMYPDKEDCPSIASTCVCKAHGVMHAEGILINIKSQVEKANKKSN